jgi:diadenosine tetraphosphate (Ap4A) HIT family hydrolase
MKIFESEKTLAFLDIGPLSKGHSVCNLAFSNSLHVPVQQTLFH